MHGTVRGRAVGADQRGTYVPACHAADGAGFSTALKGPFAPVCRTDIPFFQRQKKIVLENSGVIDPERIEDYIAATGMAR